jgi:hypothetical protein
LSFHRALLVEILSKRHHRLAWYPEPVSGEAARIEHWMVAEHQGHAAALSTLGTGGTYREAPFFWSQHMTSRAHISVTRHLESGEIRGELDKHDASAIIWPEWDAEFPHTGGSGDRGPSVCRRGRFPVPSDPPFQVRLMAARQ